jgi:hypothetical protein
MRSGARRVTRGVVRRVEDDYVLCLPAVQPAMQVARQESGHVLIAQQELPDGASPHLPLRIRMLSVQPDYAR